MKEWWRKKEEKEKERERRKKAIKDERENETYHERGFLVFGV